MSSDNENDFTTPIAASAVKKGAYLLIKGHPCKVMQATFSKTGKHGHMKASITGVCVITKRKYELSCPGHLQLQSVPVSSDKYQLSFVEGVDVHVLSEEGELQTFTTHENDELKNLISAKEADTNDETEFTVTIVSAPMTLGDEKGQLQMCHAIAAFKAEKDA